MTSNSSSVRTLPARPSLESLRKQAKTLARQVAAGAAQAVARARAQLTSWEQPLSHRDALLVLAREYGFAGWKELREEVLKRTGKGLEWAADEAVRAIHDNDVERLKVLLAEHPGLLTWRNDEERPLLQSTTPYAMDVSDPNREAEFCRPACAAVLIDAGALVTPSVWDILIRSRAAGMLRLLHEKNVLPPTLLIRAVLGDLDGVGASLNEAEGHDRDAMNMAFMSACCFKHEAVATRLLERCITLDANLGVEIDRWRDRSAFIESLITKCPSLYGTTAPWPAFVMQQILASNDLPAFTGWLQSQPWLLDSAHLALQVEILGQAAMANNEAFIRGLLERDPAVLHVSPPPPSNALIWAFDYGHAHLVPLLMPIWPLPDDLPHAAGIGNLAGVRRWFDDMGRPQLGDLRRHHRNMRPGAPTAQQVLDVALAWAIMSKHFDVAAFLVAHGADVNTDWATHEPASILHECAVHGHYEGVRFLLAHGVDPTRHDYRWNGTAAGWAKYAARDERMANLLQAEEERRMSKHAALAGSEDVAEFPARDGGEPPARSGYEAFLAVARAGDLTAMRQLAQRHPEYLIRPDAMFEAIRTRRTEIAEALLDLGMSADVGDDENFHALHFTAHCGAIGIARLLIARGVEIDPYDGHYGGTPLTHAVCRGSAEMVQLLVPHSRDVRGLCFAGATDRLRELLTARPSLVNKEDRPGETALFCLPGNGGKAAEIAGVLLSFGADPTFRNVLGETPVEVARRRGLDGAAVLLDGAAKQGSARPAPSSSTP
jgi:ankyrin repeat protein